MRFEALFLKCIMSKTLLAVAGLMTLVVISVWMLNVNGRNTSAVDQQITSLVKAYDNAIYLDIDRNAAIKAAQQIVDLAPNSGTPNQTKARGIIRLAYANISLGKWDATWRAKVKECETLITEDPTVARAELLYYSGHLIGKWGRHEFQAGFDKVQKAVQIASHQQDDRTLALAYTASNELKLYSDRTDFVALNVYRAMPVAKSYGEKSIKKVILVQLIGQLNSLGLISEAASAAEQLIELHPGSTAALFPLFATRKSSKLLDLVAKRTEAFNKLPIDAPKRIRKQAALGKQLTKLGRAYIIRNELTKGCAAFEKAIPHLKAVNDPTGLQYCTEFLRISKLDIADDVSDVDEVAAKTKSSRASILFAKAIARAYEKFGEIGKCCEWRELALKKQSDNIAKTINYSRLSSNLIWESELALRKKTELSNKKAAMARGRIGLLASALTIGLIACALLSGCYLLLRRERASLEVLVAQRTKSLNEAMQQANTADLAKSDFLSQINHEIRNPLTAILGYCELLSLQNKEPNDLVSGIESSSLHLRGLVDKILEVSKIESSTLLPELAEFPPLQTANDIHGMMVEKARKQRLNFACTFEGNASCIVSSDETKIRQIALNLIDNAIKFTETGNVTTSFKLRSKADNAGDELVIDVNDTGIGIAENDVKTVFDRFTRTGERATHDGSGLGLFIVKRLVECLKGEINLTSSVGVGTKVQVVLPIEIISDSLNLDSTPNPGKHIEPLKSLEQPAKRVLVIDDQELIRETLQLQLQSRGLECQTEWALDPAIECIENWRPDLVLLDLRMPIHSGHEVLEEIRKSNRYNVTVYAMTGDATVRVQQKCISVGFDGFITKPFNIDSILEVLQAKDLVLQNVNEP